MISSLIKQKQISLIEQEYIKFLEGKFIPFDYAVEKILTVEDLILITNPLKRIFYAQFVGGLIPQEILSCEFNFKEHNDCICFGIYYRLTELENLGEASKRTQIAINGNPFLILYVIPECLKAIIFFNDELKNIEDDTILDFDNERVCVGSSQADGKYLYERPVSCLEALEIYRNTPIVHRILGYIQQNPYYFDSKLY